MPVPATSLPACSQLGSCSCSLLALPALHTSPGALFLPYLPAPVPIPWDQSMSILCHNDTACRSGEKCCPRGCCTRCVPHYRAHRSAAACPNRCTDDRDCPGEHKCCFSGCGTGCPSPLQLPAGMPY
uniref:WAP domain-containing protein n=1 Tax=Malurus cyaneus samueli TaxID=2593467 RepID=A0A8C5TPN4_9PASS